MRVTRRLFAAAAVSFLATAQSGCATLPEDTSGDGKSFLDRLPFFGKSDKDPEPYPNPTKIASTWTPDTLVQTGRTPTRGFGGRVFFYDEKSRPVPVEGTLTVHGFDDSAQRPEDQVKRFEFTPEQFTRHFSQTDLGASYSIWIPWDAIGGDQKRVSLVTSFKSNDGTVVQGVPATLMLPGKKMELSEEQQITQFSPTYRKYLDAIESGSTQSSGLTTTTIQRRSSRAAEEAKPAITIPSVQRPKAMVATHQNTPSADLKMAKRPRRSTVMPVSAESKVR